jgi:hypothetical protein
MAQPGIVGIPFKDARSRWLMNLSTRRHRNIATVAQANKNARIA